MTDDAALAQALADRMADLAPDVRRLGVAVSGGGDSIALLHLLAPWAKARNVRLDTATVDHGLRPDAKAEIALACGQADALGLVHHTLTWDDPKRIGNLQGQARDARYRLLSDWARSRKLDAVCLAHTRDDQAETVLLRLARGSGVDGLAAMGARRHRSGVIWLRPMLDLARADLRAWLRARDIPWCEDPSNTDPRFDRVRARTALAALAPIGVDAKGLVATAHAMARAQEALGRRATEIANRGAVGFDDGDAMLDLVALGEIDAETRLRLLAEALRWVSAADYRPRLAALEAVWDKVAGGSGATLHGCALIPRGPALRICREYNAVRDCRAALGNLWDGRWIFTLPEASRAHVQALGPTGLAQIERPDDGPPHASLLSTPAIWADGSVLSVPRLKWGASARTDRAPDPASFVSALIPH